MLLLKIPHFSLQVLNFMRFYLGGGGQVASLKMNKLHCITQIFITS